MKDNVFLSKMVNEILTLMRLPKANWSQTVVHEYELSYGIILLNLESNGINTYDKSVVTPICNDLCQKVDISETRRKHVPVALNKLDYYYQFNALQPRHYSRLRLECLNKDHELVVENYLQHCLHDLFVHENTIRIKRVSAIHFMNHIALFHIAFRDITAKTVMDYLSSVSKREDWTEKTKNEHLYQLRQFLNYLIIESGVSSNSVNPLYVIFGYHAVSLPSYYEPREIKALVNEIDVTTKGGKRDYLICLLVAQLGLRAGDVSNLNLATIHWDTATIELIQQKTRNPITLPLLESLRFAILDYWKNARPESVTGCILLTTSPPHRPLSSSYISAIVTKRLRMAKIDIENRKHGCHSMRHSLAKNLLSDNEPLSTITGILGHESSNTTRKYLGIDTKTLRRISLGVPYGSK
jgi:site-specific recombinase XerD